MSRFLQKIIWLLLFIPTVLFSQTRIQMQQNDGVFYVPCKVNGLNQKFIFDTGANDVAISLSMVKFMLKNAYINKNDILGSTYAQIVNGSIEEGTKVILKKIVIDGLTLTNVSAIIVHEMKAPLRLEMSTISKLGSVTISGKELIIDHTYSNTKAKEVLINGIRWATRNVGNRGAFVSNPEDYGNYYTWFEAKSACPSGWRLPTKQEIGQLIDSGSIWTTANGTNGTRFGSGSNVIFLPAAGARYADGTPCTKDRGPEGSYWSSTDGGCSYADCLSLFSRFASLSGNDPSYRFSVRCVSAE